MKKILLGIAVLPLLVFMGCKDDDSSLSFDDLAINNEVNSFIWESMNIYYYWQQDVPNLSDNLLNNSSELEGLLNSYTTPESLFQDLLFREDRFSFIVDDYNELENSFQGTSLSTGYQLRLLLLSENNPEILAYVQYIVPGGPADRAGVNRGDLFTIVNGTTLTVDNFRSLLFSGNSYSIQLATINDADEIIQTEVSATLNFENVTENPILLSKTIDAEGQKVGYLAYTQFINSQARHEELNVAFGQFKADGVTELVLDLRFNPGGSIQTSQVLGSLIYGEATTTTPLASVVYNDRLNEAFADEDLNYYFLDKVPGTDEALNRLNISQIFILTSGGTASASELIIAGMLPYLNVTTIGTTTIGKNVGSVTFYDSDNFFEDSPRNPNHTYAIQPIISQIANADGFTDYIDGFTPNIEVDEKDFLTNLPALGDPEEPLLAQALGVITQNARVALPEGNGMKGVYNTRSADQNIQTILLDDSKRFKQFFQR